MTGVIAMTPGRCSDHSRRGSLSCPKGNLEVCLGEIRVPRAVRASQVQVRLRSSI
jgi:hypothetical protein